MTNAEKYKEVFGMEPDTEVMCPTKECNNCPFNINPNYCWELPINWWNSEYKGPNND